MVADYVEGDCGEVEKGSEEHAGGVAIGGSGDGDVGGGGGGGGGGGIELGKEEGYTRKAKAKRHGWLCPSWYVL